MKQMIFKVVLLLNTKFVIIHLILMLSLIFLNFLSIFTKFDSFFS